MRIQWVITIAVILVLIMVGPVSAGSFSLSAKCQLSKLYIFDHYMYERSETDFPVLVLEGDWQLSPNLGVSAEITSNDVLFLDDLGNPDVDDWGNSYYKHFNMKIDSRIKIRENSDLILGWTTIRTSYDDVADPVSPYMMTLSGSGFKVGLASKYFVSDNTALTVKAAYLPSLFFEGLEGGSPDENYMGYGIELEAKFTSLLRDEINLDYGFRINAYRGHDDCCGYPGEMGTLNGAFLGVSTTF